MTQRLDMLELTNRRDAFKYQFQGHKLVDAKVSRRRHRENPRVGYPIHHRKPNCGSFRRWWWWRYGDCDLRSDDRSHGIVRFGVAYHIKRNPCGFPCNRIYNPDYDNLKWKGGNDQQGYILVKFFHGYAISVGEVCVRPSRRCGNSYKRIVV